MKDKVRAAIARHHMLRRGERVCVALSGGADSVALLHVMLELRDELDFQLTALHLNHQLREEESTRDEQFVRWLCGKWHVPLTVRRSPVAELARRRRMSVEECARGVRYEFFRQFAGDAKVATAHTASDNSETVLIHLIRGTGLRGLCGIPPVRGHIIRPLIGCTRTQVEAYCDKNGLSYVEDSSNESDDYRRNRLRHHVMPLLRAENPCFEENLAETTQMLRMDANLLDKLAEEALHALRGEDGAYDRAGFLRLPGAIRPRALQALLRSGKLRYDRTRIALMERAIFRGRGGVRLAGRLELRVRADDFVLREPGIKPHRMPPAPERCAAVALPRETETASSPVFAGKKLVFRAREASNYKKSLNNIKNHLKNVLDCDRIEKILIVRYARPRDVIRPCGRGCGKTMKKLWSEQGVPPARRREILLLESGGKPVWVEGVGADDSAAPDDATLRFLTVEVVEE